jgi:hypothetical protein
MLILLCKKPNPDYQGTLTSRGIVAAARDSTPVNGAIVRARSKPDTLNSGSTAAGPIRLARKSGTLKWYLSNGDA